MNDIHTRSAEIAVRPRVSNVASPPAEGRKQGSHPAAASAESKARTVQADVKVIATQPPQESDASQQVARAVANLNDYVQSLHRDIRFALDDESGRAVVRVIDSDTKEVIRQIPSELALRLAHNLSSHGHDIGLLRIKA